MKDGDFPRKARPKEQRHPMNQSHTNNDKPITDCHCNHCAKRRSKFI